MKWVKIEDGCEMPCINEQVAIAGMVGYKTWAVDGVYEGDGRFYSDHDCTAHEATHWARVELPEE